MFYQYPPFVIINFILTSISALLIVVGNIFFILVGQKCLQERKRINSSYYFLLIGSINIIWFFIKNSLMDFIPYLSLSMQEFYLYILYIISLPSMFIEILTFTVILVLLSLKNQENYGYLLLYAAISSTIFTILAFINSFILNTTFSMGLIPTGFVSIILMILNIIAMIFLMIFNLILIIYSFKLEELYLKLASILLLLSTIFIIISLLISI